MNKKKTNNKKTELNEKELSLVVQQKRELDKLEIGEKVEKILESNQDTYKKKVALFNFLIKELEVGESQSLKEQRINYLLESRLHNKLAKKALDEYRKTTVKAFSKVKML